MSVQASQYEIFKIRAAKRDGLDRKNEVDFAEGQFRIGNIFYYENLLSPYITGVVTIISTSGAAESQDDTQGRKGSLHTSLPLEAGCEIFMKIKDPIGKGIDFSSKWNKHKRFYVNEVQVIEKSSTMEILQVRFISKLGITNNAKKITRHYKGNIVHSVRNILINELKVPIQDITSDTASNSYSFAGMSKRPFDLILMLAKQTIPTNTVNPGYFAYQTKDGFNFKSIDNIINSDPYERAYHYDGKVQSTQQLQNDGNDYKIGSLKVTQDQNLMNQIQSGLYANKSIFFNPQTYSFTEIDINVQQQKLYKDPKFSTLGKQPDTPSVVDEDLQEGTKYHRIQTAVLNVGAEKEDINPNNSPEYYYAAGSTRYNILFSQRYNITIPCNTDLKAGDVLRLEIEEITDKKEQGPDQKSSGNYVIQALCHYFEAEKSVTSLTLIRDSYGMYSSKNTSKPSAQLVSYEDSRPGVKTTRTIEISGNETKITTKKSADSSTAEGSAAVAQARADRDARLAALRAARGDG